jgi:hypothetical protein
MRSILVTNESVTIAGFPKIEESALNVHTYTICIMKIINEEICYYSIKTNTLSPPEDALTPTTEPSFPQKATISFN